MQHVEPGTGGPTRAPSGRDALPIVLASQPPRPARRTGANPIERLAVRVCEHEVAAMSASDVVQLAIWPQQLAEFASNASLSPTLVYNCLRNFKKYWRVRQALADRLGVPLEAVSHLITAPRPRPRAPEPPAPPMDRLLTRLADHGIDAGDVAALDLEGPRAAGQGDPPGARVLLPTGPRDGTNPIERKAVYRVQTEIAAMPASLVVQLALWPVTLAEWSAQTMRVRAADVYAMLTGVQEYGRLREALARQLNVPLRALAQIIHAERLAPRLPLPAPGDASTASLPDTR